MLIFRSSDAHRRAFFQLRKKEAFWTNKRLECTFNLLALNCHLLLCLCYHLNPFMCCNLHVIITCRSPDSRLSENNLNNKSTSVTTRKFGVFYIFWLHVCSRAAIWWCSRLAANFSTHTIDNDTTLYHFPLSSQGLCVRSAQNNCQIIRYIWQLNKRELSKNLNCACCLMRKLMR